MNHINFYIKKKSQNNLGNLGVKELGLALSELHNLD